MTVRSQTPLSHLKINNTLEIQILSQQQNQASSLEIVVTCLLDRRKRGVREKPTAISEARRAWLVTGMIVKGFSTIHFLHILLQREFK